MYNLEYDKRKKRYYPTHSAPTPHFAGPDYKNVCSVCYEMVSAINGTRIWLDILVTPSYWRALHDAWKEKRKANDKLRPGEDYMGR